MIMVMTISTIIAFSIVSSIVTVSPAVNGRAKFQSSEIWKSFMKF